MAASVSAATGAGAAPAIAGGRAGAPAVEQVTSGAARSLGEPAAAQDSAATAVTATSFTAVGAQAQVWTKRAGSAGWRQAGAVQPPGFGSSYDPAAAAGPGGPLLVVAGTAPPGESCITSGSVALTSVGPGGTLGAVRLVSDQRGTGNFDDRPAVAAGPHGTVWVAWSQGPDADACQDVGDGDRIEVAVSHDGGEVFGAPVAMPATGGHGAFGVRIAPLPGGQAAISWTEKTAAGDQVVRVSVLSASGHPGEAAAALTGDGPPLELPGASFYDFPAGDIAWSGGTLVVAAPFWDGSKSVIKVAAGLPGGRWQQAELTPPAGVDLLLPALGVLSPGSLRLLCAVHTRQGDRLGYDWATVSLDARGPTVGAAGLTALTPSPAGPGFFEIGEELALAPSPHGLLTAVVVAGRDGATLQTATFSALVSAPRPARTPPASTPASTATPATATPATAAAKPANGAPSGAGGTAAWAGAAALVAAAGAGGLVLWRRRGRTGPAGRSQPHRHRR